MQNAADVSCPVTLKEIYALAAPVGVNSEIFCKESGSAYSGYIHPVTKQSPIAEKK